MKKKRLAKIKISEYVFDGKTRYLFEVDTYFEKYSFNDNNLRKGLLFLADKGV